MVARGSQGYLIAVIILTLLVMVFGILSYLGFSRANDNADKWAIAKKSVDEEKAKSTSREAYVNILLTQAGVTNSKTGELDALKSQASRDAETKLLLQDSDSAFDQYISQAVSDDDAFAGANSYQQVIDELLSVVGKNHGINVSLVNQVRQEKAAAQVEIKQIQEKLDAANDKIAGLETNLSDESKRNKEKEDELQSLIVVQEGRITDLTNDLTNKQKEVDQAIQDKNTQVAEMQKELLKIKRENELLTSLGESILPDGKVTNVTGNIISLNVGSADGLRKHQGFLVYDARETDFENALPKAKIQVKKSNGEHTSEALIVERISGSPILSEDHIISRTWDPGYNVPVAIVGMIDLDGDGSPDTERFKSLLEQNGANVVAWHDEMGNRNGDISSTTEYLIVGDSPTKAEVASAFTFYNKQAERYSVREISARRFLKLLYVRPSNAKALNRDIGTFRRRSTSDVWDNK